MEALIQDYLAPVVGPRNTAGFLAGYQLYNYLDKHRTKFNRFYKTNYSPVVKSGNYTRSFKPSVGTPVTARYRKMPMRRRVYRKRPLRRRYRRRRISKKARWQARARREVGEPRNHSSSKTCEAVSPSVISNKTNTPSFLGLIQIADTSGNSINDRQRYICNVSGVKIDVTFTNLFSDQRIYINWAVVHPKQGQKPSSTPVGMPDFFRRYTTTRSLNPDSTSGTGTTRNWTGMSYSVAAINTDDYVVLKRGKFMLTPGSANGYHIGMKTKEKSIWLKLNRQFEFGTGSSEPGDQVYFVSWAAIPNADTDPLPTTGNAYSYTLRAINYFREPKVG